MFHDIVSLDKTGWPRCLLWHGWLPALSGTDDGDPWAVDAADVASKASLHSLMMMSHLLMLLMSGLIGVWSWMGFQVSALLGMVFMHMVLVLLGLVDSGGTWICFHLCLMVLVRLAGFIVLFLALCRLCSGLRFEEF